MRIVETVNDMDVNVLEREHVLVLVHEVHCRNLLLDNIPAKDS